MRRITIISILLLLFTIVAQAQITIGGNVYGGGNQGYVQGNTTVTVRAGNIGARDTTSNEAAELPMGKVFGGARMANVGGNAFVHVDIGHASDSMVINYVFGGNDIAGTIGVNPNAEKRVPKELPDTVINGVNSSWNSFVLFSTKTDTIEGKVTEAEVPKIYVGQAYGGGNGDYYYADQDGSGNYNVYASDKVNAKLVATGTSAFTLPNMAKTFLDIHGGTIAHCYGGGNAVTVTDSAVICIDNPSAVVTSVLKDGKNLLDSLRLREMGIHTGLAKTESADFQIGSVFGGNNKATMRIRPTWHLQAGSVRNLYSGGNRGDMRYKGGLLLEIPSTSTIVVDNLFGGCRMADVRPQEWDEALNDYKDVDHVTNEGIALYKFPPNLAARTIIAGGDVNNVYGGNDVRGKVYFGDAIGIQASVRGDVYGGGNGAYAYTDAASNEHDDTYGDYWYSTDSEHPTSVDALNAIRPNAEQVSIQVRGTEEKTTVIGGSIYVGGNCATLVSDESHKDLPDYPLTELKIGSHVIAENVFLGNNGAMMVDEDILKKYASDFSTLDFAQDATEFANYMKGVTMSHVPRMIAESTKKGDRMDYEPYSSYIGSLYYGGNRGSMTYKDSILIEPEVPVIIYNKLVGGCNNANVPQTAYNARYEGGIMGAEDERDEYVDASGNIKNRIVMNLSEIRFQPMRLDSTGVALEWNTYNLNEDGVYVPEYIKRDTLKASGEATAWDMSRRLVGGNLYGGCHESGHVNGNIVINIKDSLHNRHIIFDAFEGEEDGDDILYERDTFKIVAPRKSGVILNKQGMDVLGEALSVYAGGKGKETEVWGSATVNIQKGYTFQVFGGSEEGAIGRGTWNETAQQYDYPTDPNPAYSTYVNMNSVREGVPRGSDQSADVADVEFIYGGGFSGPILGNTCVHLDNGRLFNLFAGSCNADIKGHTETYVGLNGFPYLRDHIYGGNDLGGEIKQLYSFADRVRSEGTMAMVHAKDADGDGVKDVLQANTYIEYRQGKMKEIYGGNFGNYDYVDEFTREKGYSVPRFHNAFINFRPDDNAKNHVNKVFGGGEGCLGVREVDESQDRSYVLVDIADNKGYYANTEFFGSGSNNGLGMKYTFRQTTDATFNPDDASAIIDLANGQVGSAYGGSYNEGITRRTLINVPEQSTIKIKNIFGGAYGTNALPPCDVYEANVDYRNTSEQARVSGAIYGGNNSVRRTIYGHVDISSPVWQTDSTLSTVYGAGLGPWTWSEYTNVNLKSGAKVYQVFGGGQMGEVLNAESIQAYMQMFDDIDPESLSDLPAHIAQTYDPNKLDEWRTAWRDAWTLGSYYVPNDNYDNYVANDSTNLNNTFLTREAEMDERTEKTYKYNTNVIIEEGATVAGYAYGGGLGETGVANSGDIFGSTYIALLGGTVNRDIYAAGTTGSVYNVYAPGVFTASSNAYIQGGTVRNVYGGGWKGSVGMHAGDISASTLGDIPAETHVVIGKADADSVMTSSNGPDKIFANGFPAIQRNVYAGGEGGSVFGTAHLKINNGYIGYLYENKRKTYKYLSDHYVENVTESEENDLDGNGNAFGGGYVVNSFVDKSHIEMLGGTIRGSLYGGGELGPIGRGTKLANATGGVKNGDATIYRPGHTLVEMYNGHVLRNVFGGGRGKDSWGGDGTLYMDEDVKATLDLSSKGTVFGQTEVRIHGGEVGTVEGMALEFGNVFGGGDEGYVYSAYENADGTFGLGVKKGQRYKDDYQGNYFKHKWNGEGGSDSEVVNSEGFLTHDAGELYMTEDCKVLVEPWLQLKNDLTYDGKSYESGEYIPIGYLNTLPSKNADGTWPSEWLGVDAGSTITEDGKTIHKERGVIIHNAVFAGGNIAEGSNQMNANVSTVFGNATASINDVYNRDLVTIGTGHTGGLYGDGNLTLVDGYRELNITNYGTDYYNINNEQSRQITIEQYNLLPPREQAYYEVKYKCVVDEITDGEGTTYTKDSTLPEDELVALFDTVKVNGVSVIVNGKPNTAFWEENGVVSIYAGRIMNTIQRADLCGVWGSRMVMKGARDRVPEKLDFTNYTINRVREVSLNKKQDHGNYFGIYSVVNYLGALTSDVKFDDLRTTAATEAGYTADGKTFAQWKAAHSTERSRNNGSCHNKLALASGVYLELTTELSKGDSLRGKDWGPITGIVELDLINVQPGIGGGFVYAQNIHGKKSLSGRVTTTLTALNDGAATKWDYIYPDPYDYPDDTHQETWETSGNFINSSINQPIIDDCYNVSGRYAGSNRVPAHYWYIQGQVYVYDQYISAYTGSPNAYSETVDLPLTIAAALNGKMTLMDVQPNLYAYYSSYTNANTNTKLTGDSKIVINDVTYSLNDPISYWDWSLLPSSLQKLFVEDTYIVTDSCKIGNTVYPADSVLLVNDYATLKAAVDSVTLNDGTKAAFAEVFHPSNNMSHNTGYLLTYTVDNPNIWDQWYTPKTGDSYDLKNQTGGDGYEDGPTFHPTVDGLYGQKEYAFGDIITAKSDTVYRAALVSLQNGGGTTPANQAMFELAYITTAYAEATDTANRVQHLQKGASLARSSYDDGQWSANLSGKVAPAFVCTATIQLAENEFIYPDQLMTEDEKTALYNRFNKSGATDEEKQIAQDIKELIVPAYYCTKGGYYGGDYYTTNQNYRALAAWSAMSEADRAKFEFNYDALDLLVDSLYGKGRGANGTQQKEGVKFQYDGKDFTTKAQAETNKAGYSLKTPIDYTATYNGKTTLTYTDSTNASHSVASGAELTRSQFEALPNEQRHYAPITVTEAGEYYVVYQSFIHGETPYPAGKTLTAEEVNSLSQTERNYIDTLQIGQNDLVSDGNSGYKPYYYCREEYVVNENGMGVSVTDYIDKTQYSTKQTVPVGTLITAEAYKTLPNKQLGFTVHSSTPTETSTLYVRRNSDINDLSKEKIITVIYQYDYDESDSTGLHINPISERHVVRIHINFESGIPVIDPIRAPGIVLPGTSISMATPRVQPGAYEIQGGGWELFEKESYAENHTNGVEYRPSRDSLYWYQDGYYIAYYAKTYLGKTYSNYVPVSVANYHDLRSVMRDSTYHLYVDYDRTRLHRDSKIYINDYSANNQNGLDLLKDLYDLTLVSGTGNGYTVAGGKITATTEPANSHLKGHALLNTDPTNGPVGAQNLQFILRTDLDYSAPSGSDAREWTPIAPTSGNQCFEGTFHGDGHTISGLNNSLFGKLCGSVYNLGVTGSFSSAGVADTGDGYVENCWINTTGTPDGSVYAVFGEPTTSEGNEGKQIVNSYYQSSKNYKTAAPAHDHGLAIAKSDTAFYNGEVAYDLNGFYLYKRYNDNAKPAATVAYKYWQPGKAAPQDGTYAQNEALCSSGYHNIKYVEDRFADGDFIYADGTIPIYDDERYDTDSCAYFPFWPDDYLFFGQALNYNHLEGHTHQNTPSSIIRSGNRVLADADGNRVYRAPAYFRSNTMSVAHFNPYAVFAQSNAKTVQNQADTVAYRYMTAIDFTGGNGDVAGGYKLGGTTKFYPPLLDDGGLTGFLNVDLTQNLLVYTGVTGNDSLPSEKTATVVGDYLLEPVYAESDDGYRTVAHEGTDHIHGHWVENGIAPRDHLLVDRQDFNAPMGYKFTDDYRMWHQRTPDRYVDRTKGWESISLPFNAELVTTDRKGEITHFYNGSHDSFNNTHTKIGHEYWLRNLQKNSTMTQLKPDTLTAAFGYPTANDGFAVTDKTVTNTFLWDYYYKGASHNQKDANGDTYLEYYRDKNRKLTNYQLLTRGVPYIIGFPGVTYYEFDLSGQFEAKTTGDRKPEKLGQQTITFASEAGDSIRVSDNEMKSVNATYNGTTYTFKPSYLNMVFKAGTERYAMNAAGSSYDRVPATGDSTVVEAFRPYFISATSEARQTRSIVFSNGPAEIDIPHETQKDEPGTLIIYPLRKKIVVESSLRYETEVRIVTLSGITINAFTIKPGESVETRVNTAGVYIIQTADGEYTKKLAVH